MTEPADHAIGRSRGGLTTKIHLIADGQGRPLVLLLTAGNVNDTLMFAPLLDALQVARPGPGRPRTRPDYVLADKGYSSRANRELLRRRHVGHTIPEPRDQQANRRRRAAVAGARSGSTRSDTAAATSSNAGSASSSTGVGLPPATTGTPATTSADSLSPRS